MTTSSTAYSCSEYVKYKIYLDTKGHYTDKYYLNLGYGEFASDIFVVCNYLCMPQLGFSISLLITDEVRARVNDYSMHICRDMITYPYH